jgi:hypothetical protein
MSKLLLLKVFRNEFLNRYPAVPAFNNLTAWLPVHDCPAISEGDFITKHPATAYQIVVLFNHYHFVY